MTRRILALLLCFLLPCCALAESADAVPADDAVEVTAEELQSADADVAAVQSDPTLTADGKLDAIFRKYATMGACVVVVENGAVTYTHCYGLRDRDGEPVTEDTIFRVGSISKMITAIGVLQLVQDGRLTLDDDLGDALGFAIRHPQYPNTVVTLRQLMSHSTGLRDSGAYTRALRGDPLPLDQLFSGERLQYAFLTDFEPGMDCAYSNFGGGLLACLIERLTGQTLDEYMRRNVFEPLGITAAYQGALLPADAPVANMYAMPGKRQTATLRDGKPAATAPDPLRDYVYSAGKLMISAPDLAKLVIALCDGGIYRDPRLLKESAVADMTAPQNHVGSVACDTNRGLCMNIILNAQVEGRLMYGHGGKANGMLCAAYFDPTDRTGVVMLTNGCRNNSVHNGVGMLGRAVMRICYDELLSAHVAADPFVVSE